MSAHKIKHLFIASASIVLLSGTPYFRADTKVVVIPLGSGPEINSTSTPAANPIGTIISSMLTPVQFATTQGDLDQSDVTIAHWVLADGRDISGSEYANVTGTSNIPDMRGMFLRGQNNDRADGNENPDGEITLGDYQNDTFQDHTHSTTQMIFNNNIDGVDSAAIRVNEHHNETRQTGGASARAGVETRPKNITVNYYIKIN